MDQAYQNNNREVWRQDMHDPMDLSNYYAPSVFVVGDSAIGIDAGGTVHVRDVREWAKMPDEIARLTAQLAAMTERKDGWRRVAREYWWLVSEDTMRRQSIIRRDRRRREARNGHTD